jgi:hypothetical protein
MEHGFPGTGQTLALIADLEADAGPLSIRAAKAIRTMDRRLAELEETLKFVAENGEHFLLLTNSEEFADLSDRYQRLVELSRRMGEIEIGDGCLVFRAGSLSITVAAETATVFNIEKYLPAKRIRLACESFFEEADDFLRPL